LKHTVSTLKLFGKTNIRFGYVDYDLAYTAITVHLEWNLIFFVGAERTIIAYDMDQRKVHVIPTSVDHSYDRHKVLSWFMSRPLLSSLCSLVLVLGVISKAVNKAAFDVCLCHDMFKWTNVI